MRAEGQARRVNTALHRYNSQDSEVFESGGEPVAEPFEQDLGHGACTAEWSHGGTWPQSQGEADWSRALGALDY